MNRFIKVFIIVCLFTSCISTTDVKSKNTYIKALNTNHTEEIQNMISDGGTIMLPNKKMFVDDRGINIPSNTTIIFQEQTELIMLPTNKTNYALLNIEESKNVKVLNPNLTGDRYTHLGEKGEWGMGIQITGGKNIEIIGGSISKFWGDGIYITRSSNFNSSEVLIEGVLIDNNRRNGISVISGDKVKILNCELKNHDGTNPKAGIDVEPNSPRDSIGTIVVKQIQTSKNKTGVQISMMKYPSEKEQVFTIDIDGLNSVNDQHGLLIRDFYRIEKYGYKALPLNGIVNYKNLHIQHSVLEPIKYFNSKEGYKYGPKYNFYNIKIVKEPNSIKWMSSERIKAELKSRGFNTNDF